MDLRAIVTCSVLLAAFLALAAGPVRAQEAPASAGPSAEKTLEAYLPLLDQLSSVGPTQRESLLRGVFGACQKLLDQGNTVLAVRGLTALLPPTKTAPLGEPFSAQVRKLLEEAVTSLVLGGESRAALPALQALMVDGPGPAMRWAILARAYLDLGSFDKAQEALKQGLKLFPDSAELLFVRATLAGATSEVAVARGSYAQAESFLREAAADLERALSRAPAAAGIHRALGKIRASLWEYSQATGRTAEAQKLLAAAEDSYSEAVQLDPANPEPALEAAQLLANAQDWRWARVYFRQALERAERLAGKPDLLPTLRQPLKQLIDRCRASIAGTIHNQALDALNLGHYDRARAMAQLTSRDLPAYAGERARLKKLVDQRERGFQLELAQLGKVQPVGDSQVLQGDLWLRLRRFDQAGAAYRQAAEMELAQFSPTQVQDRVFGTTELPGDSRIEHWQVGTLAVEAELPTQGFDANLLLVQLTKAHARAMGILPYRLVGALSIKVFANQRMFLELGGERLGPLHQAFYSGGRILTYAEPHRGAGEWQKILMHGLAHRIVDEMSYSRAPRWLVEGLSRWASEPWTAQRRLQLKQLADRNRLFPFSQLDRNYVEGWNDPETLEVLYLQSQHMVLWLIRSYGFEKLLDLLAGLRQGHPLNKVLAEVYELKPETIEHLWKAGVGQEEASP